VANPRPGAPCWTKVLSREGRRLGTIAADDGSRVPSGTTRDDAVDALVTGGTGFVGANVARELIAAGATVRVLARPRADRRALQGLRVEIADGDLLNPSSVRRAMDGVQTVYHVAADYRLWTPDPTGLYRTNVDGTRVVLEVAGEAGVSRVVHTSSVAALGVSPDGRPATEDTPVSLDDMVSHYERSKFLAEQLVLDFARRGLPVIVVNPAAPLGPWDVRPTPTGQMIVDFMRGRVIATVDTGLNAVHVRDVARGHLLAAERGKPGERYILGHQNLALTELFGILAELTGRRPPRLHVPYAMAWLGAACFEGLSRVTRRPPAVPLAAVRMARKRKYFSAARAVRELGLPQTDVREALADAVAWFNTHGYAERRST
jgi:dihydroflavonol-4-reductase